MPPDTGPLILHATAVAVGGRAALIRGRPGSGKSGLALEMMARGALLVADDRVEVRIAENGLEARAPAAIRGLIEARGIGILQAEMADSARAVCIVDLDQEETERLPPPRTARILGVDLPLFHKFASPYFPAGLVQYLKGGRKETS